MNSDIVMMYIIGREDASAPPPAALGKSRDIYCGRCKNYNISCDDAENILKIMCR